MSNTEIVLKNWSKYLEVRSVLIGPVTFLIGLFIPTREDQERERFGLLFPGQGPC